MGDRRRKLAFAGAAVVLLGITGFLALRDPVPALQRDARTERPAGPSAIRTEPPGKSQSDGTGEGHGSPPSASPTPSPAPSPASATRGEGEARNAPAVAPREARAAAAAARAFLDGYLPYSYGGADVQRIRPAATALLRELKESPPRVPARVARARPQLVFVHAEAATGGSDVDVVAVVKDGRRRYRIPLALRHTGRRWVAIAISG